MLSQPWTGSPIPVSPCKWKSNGPISHQVWRRSFIAFLPKKRRHFLPSKSGKTSGVDKIVVAPFNIREKRSGWIFQPQNNAHRKIVYQTIGYREGSNRKMKTLDQLGNTINLSSYPKRVISLVPSLTELLFDLGLDEEIVGITAYCVLPEEKVSGRVKVGGTKQFDFKIIDDLKPDLIIGSKEENDQEAIRRLQERYPVWISHVVTIEDALEMIKAVGTLVNRRADADQLVREINKGMGALPAFRPMRAAYLIWKNPYMVAAGATFINEMLRKCGYLNLFENQRRYPQIILDDLNDAEVILLSSEPYPFTSEDVDFFTARNPYQRVYLVNGKMFSWYGSRMKYALAYFKKLRSS